MPEPTATTQPGDLTNTYESLKGAVRRAYLLLGAFEDQESTLFWDQESGGPVVLCKDGESVLFDVSREAYIGYTKVREIRDADAPEEKLPCSDELLRNGEEVLARALLSVEGALYFGAGDAHAPGGAVLREMWNLYPLLKDLHEKMAEVSDA